jgi:hypothetical protein
LREVVDQSNTQHDGGCATFPIKAYAGNKPNLQPMVMGTCFQWVKISIPVPILHINLHLTCGYTCTHAEHYEQPQVWVAVVDADSDKDDDNSPEPGPKALSSIELAHSPGMSFIHIPFDPYTD